MTRVEKRRGKEKTYKKGIKTLEKNIKFSISQLKAIQYLLIGLNDICFDFQMRK
jgi:hypothetical protein